MATTDNPLKLLVSSFPIEFAEWLLQTTVQESLPLNVELPGQDVEADNLYLVTLTDGESVLLHIEFQGRRSHREMQWRMLDYMSRFAQQHQMSLCSVVLYVGRGAGKNDSGQYQILCPRGKQSLAWHYQVIRLWEMEADELLELNNPALLALVGQTKISRPETTLPRVVESIRTVSQETLRDRLFTSLITLLEDEELTTMIEKMIDRDELMLDTPFIRRWKREAKAEGLAEGLTQGKKEGQMQTRQQSIIDIIALRFNPPALTYRDIEKTVNGMTDMATLDTLFEAAIRAEDVAAFEATLQELTAA